MLRRCSGAVLIMAWPHPDDAAPNGTNGSRKSLPLPLPIHQIATFASDPYRGNPTYVVTLDAMRPRTILQALCRHLRESMIAVLAVEGKAVNLYCITPTGSHPGAGHTTHAAAWVAFSRLFPDVSTLELALEGGGRRSIRTEDGLIAVDWPIMPYHEVDQVSTLRACLGKQPLQTYLSSFGVIAIFADEGDIATLRPDLSKIALLPSDTVIVTAPASKADFAIRVFAPKMGLPEDPVCGTAHRILAPLWAARTNRRNLVSHQLSERSGELFCRLDGDIVTIAGRAVPILDGTIALPD